ncbi:hypothetical protein [Pseudoteredinibacter isoporae]|uniref:Fibronectin type-III domain-containing protein n=1 Tax=Pseudoteredinibacter isoporae TaxID=570281 RepID=A0A7X0JT23_9GAMM|nr:hypothetical protein [Pseudoteredinibacter isoporae]MBB6521742.1 hypothetical protein [Pseudoteredinibacter isoporae]NHO87290.1 hypothetical protein [Pseudoteredinibacter isoporae]NIB23078.1 hypothetical protein [Pseudoteredinibacter isoporae]
MSRMLFVIFCIFLVFSGPGAQAKDRKPVLNVNLSAKTVIKGDYILINWSAKQAKRKIIVRGDKFKRKFKGKKVSKGVFRGIAKLYPKKSGTYHVSARNIYGVATRSFDISVVDEDYESPSAPVFDSRMVTGNSVALSWFPSEDNVSHADNISYLLYLFEDGENINFDMEENYRYEGEVRSYLEGLPENKNFNVYILSEDEFGNRSNPVGPIKVETGWEKDAVTIDESETVYNLTQMGVDHEIDGNTVYIDFSDLKVEPMVGDYLISYSEYEIYYLKITEVLVDSGRYEIFTENVSPFEFLTPGRISIGFLYEVKDNSFHSNRSRQDRSVGGSPLKFNFDDKFDFSSGL